MEKIATEKFEQKEKPEMLYVSAQTKGIKEIIPMSGRHRGGNEGPIIFSTPDKGLASIFLVEGHNDSWMEIGTFGGVPYTVICMKKEDFIKRDSGGSIYEVSSDTFDFNPNLGMGEKEWTSNTPVRPNNETEFPSALDAMINNGAYVFFVDQETFKEIQKADDHGFEILSSMTSENRRRNSNTQSFKQAVESSYS